jgi:hypothetical protein
MPLTLVPALARQDERSLTVIDALGHGQRRVGKVGFRGLAARFSSSSARDSDSACTGSSASKRSSAICGSAMRPAALRRGASANATDSAASTSSETLATAASAAIDGRVCVRIRATPSATSARFSAESATMSATVPSVARSVRSRHVGSRARAHRLHELERRGLQSATRAGRIEPGIGGGGRGAKPARLMVVGDRARPSRREA